MNRKLIYFSSAVLIFWQGMLACAGSEADTVNYKEIDIYIYNWNVSVRAGLKEVDVRMRHSISISYTDDDDIHNLAGYFFQGKYEDILKGQKPDVRVVVDIVADNNEKYTFLMNKGYIFNRQLTLAKEADSKFIEYLDNIMNTDMCSWSADPCNGHGSL
jgi:hypothetical protein